MPGGMQLIHEYKKQLDRAFLPYYLDEFARRRMVYVHWSAGHRNTNFADYHSVVLEERGKVRVARNCPAGLDQSGHTYQRNTGSAAVCVASMFGASASDLGPEQPTPAQLQVLVEEVASVCLTYRIPVGNIMTHAEAADNVDGAAGLDFYGPRNGCERWDFWCWIAPHSLRLAPCTRPAPPGYIYFPDWLRGEVALRIQSATTKHWKGA